MKISIELQVEPEEIPLATELFQIFKDITQQINFPSNNNNQTNLADYFTENFKKLESPASVEEACSNINNKLEKSENVDETFKILYEAFNQILFSNSSTKTILPYLSFLPNLIEPYKMRVRDKLIPQVLEFLTLPRKVDCNRTDFFFYAETFAGLIKLGFVSITGAVTTILTLLLTNETKCAAVTMLGKTVELCLQLLKDNCEIKTLFDLRMGLQNVTDEALKYDVSYIQQNMDWQNNLENMSLPSSNTQTWNININSSLNENSNMPTANHNPILDLNQGSTPYFRPDPNLPIPNYGAPKSEISSGFLQQKNDPEPAVKFTEISKPVSESLQRAKTEGKQLVAKSSFTGHTNTIVSVCYHENSKQIISSDKDGVIMLWSEETDKKEQISISNYYACSMDIISNSLLLCGVGREEGQSPAILNYKPNSNKWFSGGTIEKKGTKLVSCVKAICQDSGENVFITGEATPDPVDGNILCLYKYGTQTKFSKSKPALVYKEHSDIITSLASHKSLPNCFFSGSRDLSIKFWDSRNANSISTLKSHTAMITCIDCKDNLLVSGSLDKKIMVWDIRKLTNQGLFNSSEPVNSLFGDGSGILKVAVGQSNVAISTLKGLYLCDFEADFQLKPAVVFEDRSIGRYHDMSWNSKSSILYCAGDDKRIDKYNLE